MTAPTIPYEWVCTPERMNNAVSILAQSPSLALDMEMENHCHLYGLHIALLQFSTPDARHFIIDPLADIDLHPLVRIFADPARQLILHDADFDRRASRQVYGWELRGIFDTKTAAQLCGHRKFGLGNMLADYFGVATNKRFQTTNWMQRPLPDGALEYAVGDTAYLHDLRDRLAARLAELGRADWATEEFEYAERREIRAPDLPMHQRIKRSALLTPRQLAVLGALATFRDSLAKELNRPLHFIMRNEIILELAARRDLTAGHLRGLRGVHPALRQSKNIEKLLAAWRSGMAAPEESHPARARRPRAAPNGKQRLKAMQEWRTALAAEYDLEPYLMLDNDVLCWCANHPGLTPPQEIAALIRNWQRKVCWPGFAEKFDLPSSKQDVLAMPRRATT